MPLTLIAAAAGKKQVIGKNGVMPWHFPADLRFFKQTTLSHPLLMGRKTYQSIVQQWGKPLPGRPHLIVTRDRDFHDDRVQVFHSIEAALASQPPDQTVFVAGGQQIYEQTIQRADQLLITHIDLETDGDAFFPSIDPAHWQLTRETIVTDQNTQLRFCTYSASK